MYGLLNTSARYLQLVVTPSHPDNLGGSTYTFGITDVSGAAVEYNLVSDLFFLPVTFPVRASSMRLQGEAAEGLTGYRINGTRALPRQRR